MKFAFVTTMGDPVGPLVRGSQLGLSRRLLRMEGPPVSDRASRIDGSANRSAVHEEAWSVYGSPPVAGLVPCLPVVAYVNTVAKLMKEKGIRSKARRRFVPRRPTAGIRTRSPRTRWTGVYPDKPDAAWVRRCLRGVRRGLAVLPRGGEIDLCTRKVVGWATADRLPAQPWPAGPWSGPGPPETPGWVATTA